MAEEKLEKIEERNCPECGRPDRSWYDDRDRHMVELFRAGWNSNQIGKAYRVGPERLRQILVTELGTEAMWRIIRVHSHNKQGDEDVENTDDEG